MAKSLEQRPYPLWEFLSNEFGIDVAFSVFAPYHGANIKVKVIDNFTVESSMELIPSNTNYVGTHFGGSLYSMCDPFYMLILVKNLGPEYLVWDKSAAVDFISPGTGVVKARFHIPSDEIVKIKQIVAEKRKVDMDFHTQILDEAGKIVANLKKGLYIRRILKKNDKIHL